MSGAVSRDIDEIQAILAPWLGAIAWSAEIGYASFLTVEFGAPVENGTDRSGAPFIFGEWHLWIYCSAWRLETADGVLAACEDERDHMGRGAAALNGRAIEAVAIALPSLETEFRFAGGILLKVFPVYSGSTSEDPVTWMLFTPGGMVLSVGPGSAWRHGSSSGADA